MRPDRRRLLLPPGPILSTMLVGLMLLGGLLYYKAVRAQRFLEPVLAITQPSAEFSEGVRRLFLSEFGGEYIRGIKLLGDSFYVDGSMIAYGLHRPDEPPVLKKLARVLLSALKDKDIGSSVDIILVSTTVPLSTDMEQNRLKRKEMRERAGLVLNTLYSEEPELERLYSMRFVPSVISADVGEERAQWIEFRFIHSQMFHIETLRRFQKYVR